MDIAVLFLTMFLLIGIGVPIGYAIGFSTLVTIIIYTDIPLVIVAQKAFTGVDSFPLMAIPFFILAGTLMTHGGIARRILNFINVFIGSITGGLGIVTTVSCMFFGAISGSAIATTSAMGSFMIPAMEEKKYDKSFAAAITASAGTIGIIIPPSIPFVIYGVVTNTSIGDLFIAGVIPGVLMGIALILTCYIISKRRGYVGDDTKMSWALAWKEFRSAIWALLSPIIVLGGIYGGIFTPTEAAVVSVVYSLVIGVFVYRELDFVKIKRALFDTLIINGITTFMIGLSMIFATYLSLNQVPQRIAAFLLEVTDNKILLLLMINIFLLLVGCLIDNIPACIILAPILLPVVVSLGMTPLQFGIVLTMNLAIGFITPPYGPNLFVAASVANISVDKMFRQILPFILALFIVLMICTYIPATTTLLVGMMR